MPRDAARPAAVPPRPPQDNLWHMVFGAPDTRRLVRENLHGMAAARRAAHIYLTSPVMVLIYAIAITFLMMGMIRPEYTAGGITPFVSNLLTSAKLLAYWAVSYALLPYFVVACLRIGLPFVAAPLVMWFIAVTLSNTVSFLFDSAIWDMTRLPRQAILTIPCTIACVHAVAHRLRETLGEVPQMVPIWRPITAAPVPLLLKLPAGRRGRLLRIHAANQYVEVVTDLGTTLLRLSLGQAVTLVPDDLGWLCHRSMWIARDQVGSLSYVRGQPQITDRAGQSWAISRKVAPAISDWVATRRATGPQA